MFCHGSVLSLSFLVLPLSCHGSVLSSSCVYLVWSWSCLVIRLVFVLSRLVIVLFDLVLVLVLSWFYFILISARLVLSWSCLCLVLFLSCLCLVLDLSWPRLALVLSYLCLVVLISSLGLALSCVDIVLSCLRVRVRFEGRVRVMVNVWVCVGVQGWGKVPFGGLCRYATVFR